VHELLNTRRTRIVHVMKADRAVSDTSKNLLRLALRGCGVRHTPLRPRFPAARAAARDGFSTSPFAMAQAESRHALHLSAGPGRHDRSARAIEYLLK